MPFFIFVDILLYSFRSFFRPIMLHFLLAFFLHLAMYDRAHFCHFEKNTFQTTIMHNIR